jgi:hypothetical protein
LREREEKVFGAVLFFFWLCCYADNTKGGEGMQLSTSFFRSHQLSLGLYHAGGVWEEGDGVGGGCFIGFNYSLLNSISISAVLLIVDILYFYPMIKTNKIKIFYLRCSRN